MGLNMSARLQEYLRSRGENLKYSNRTVARGKGLDELGAQLCPNFESLVQSCDVIFTMVRVSTTLKVTCILLTYV